MRKVELRREIEDWNRLSEGRRKWSDRQIARQHWGVEAMYPNKELVDAIRQAGFHCYSSRHKTGSLYALHDNSVVQYTGEYKGKYRPAEARTPEWFRQQWASQQ